MKRILLATVILLAGCTHASVRVNSDGSTTTTTTGISVGVSGHAGPAAWALIGIGLIAAEHASPQRATEPRPARLDAARRVNQVDCTKPIEDWSANLKCK